MNGRMPDSTIFAELVHNSVPDAPPLTEAEKKAAAIKKLEGYRPCESFEVITEGPSTNGILFKAALLTALEKDCYHSDAFLGAAIRVMAEEYLQ